ncbi:MAG TPA: hypothetical protein VL944_00150 [Candidatus Acidoferrum sp.]|nr:hypothetical protein [Candidatus Acidoferrum sp.]
MPDIKELTIGDLLARLHSAIVEFVGTVGSIVKQDREVSMGDIRELRNDIKERLQRNEKIDENKKLLKVLDLFTSDSAVLELVKEDAEEWLSFIDHIEKSMEQKGAYKDLTSDERAELERIKKTTSDIKALIRSGS